MDENQGEESQFPDLSLNDSFQSVGNSTRSLLSPILKEKIYLRSSTPERHAQQSESENEEVPYYPDKSKHMILTSISLSRRNENGSASLGTSKRSSYSSFSSSTDSSKSKDKECQLSPWENWLVQKTLENRQKAKERKIEESKKKKDMIEKERQEHEKQKIIREKVTEWIENKEVNESMRRERKKQEMEEQQRLKVEKQIEIEEKSKVVYQKWLERKKAADLEQKKKREEKEREQKEKEIKKRMESEQAFEDWLKKSKRHSKSENCGFCYGQEKALHKRNYDWSSYPSPSYINPMPWMHPTSKHNSRHKLRRKELQPVSPPLLFRDYEQRTKKVANKS